MITGMAALCLFGFEEEGRREGVRVGEERSERERRGGSSREGVDEQLS